MNQENNKKQANNSAQKPLPEIFKELKAIQKQQVSEQIEEKNTKKTGNKRVKNQDNTKKQKIKINFDFLKERHDPVHIAMVAVLSLLGLTIFSSNYIFAKEDNLELENEPKQIIGTFEKNQDVINLPEILTENMNITESKEMLVAEREIAFETEYIENDKLPKDEQVILQEGVIGKEEVTFIRTYTNSQIENDNIINIKTLENPVTEKIDVGTSEFLAQLQVHLGDTIYAKERVNLYKEANEASESIGVIVQNYDVTLLDIEADWCKIQIFDYIGYVKQSYLTSANINPEIVEKCRKQKIITNVNEDMWINQKSELTIEDFKQVLSNNLRDRQKIFEQNAEVFYEMEQKYNINGIFLASIGIHESNWGNSTIAQNKRNLFGYGSYDSDPYNMSFIFESYAEGIELVAKVLTKYYINEPGTDIFDEQEAVGSYYNGPTVRGVNVRYASDPEWNIKVFNIMQTLYEKIAP